MEYSKDIILSINYPRKKKIGQAINIYRKL